MLDNLLYKAYAIKSTKLREVIRRLIKWLEGGELYSMTLRKIYLDYHDTEIGLYSYGPCFDLDRVPSGTRIGRYGSFGYFWIYSRNHPVKYISMHPFFFNTKLGYVDTEKVPSTKLRIGHGVWICHNTFILPSVSEIGNGAVIAAGTVVTKNVPPYAIFAGNPGKVVKYRFPQSIIDEIEQMAWWEKNIEELLEEFDKFTQDYPVNT